jgi:hypothetical protein
LVFISVISSPAGGRREQHDSRPGVAAGMKIESLCLQKDRQRPSFFISPVLRMPKAWAQIHALA